MKRYKQLDDLEMHEILRLIYPEAIQSDEDEYFDLSSEICDAPIWIGDKETTLAEFLGRVVTLTLPIRSGISNKSYHVLGEVTVGSEMAHIIAAVKREASHE